VVIEGADMRPAVAWHHLIPNGGRKRSSLRTVTILEEDWFRLMALDTEHTIGWYVQAKSTQRLNVSATLKGLMQWMRSHT
jgi:hypothetical protein